MKIAWLTDTHLNFLTWEGVEKFLANLPKDVDAFLHTGDISDGCKLKDTLELWPNNKPLYFVLGNHDFWHQSIKDTLVDVKTICSLNSNLIHLTLSNPIKLDEKTYLVGVDSWADGGYGDYVNSPVRLNDSVYIPELKQAASIGGKMQVLQIMQQLAKVDAERLDAKIQIALKNKKLDTLIVAIHVPPFEEAALYQGKRTDKDFLPFFTSKVTGDVILKHAKANPHVQFKVYCGHTHDKTYYKKLDNLEINVGGATYNDPEVQGVIWTGTD